MNKHFQPTDHHILQTSGGTNLIGTDPKNHFGSEKKEKIPLTLKSWLITNCNICQNKASMLLLHILQGKVKKSHISEARLRTHLARLLEKKSSEATTRDFQCLLTVSDTLYKRWREWNKVNCVLIPDRAASLLCLRDFSVHPQHYAIKHCVHFMTYLPRISQNPTRWQAFRVTTVIRKNQSSRWWSCLLM